MRARVLWIRYLFIAKAHGASISMWQVTIQKIICVCNVSLDRIKFFIGHRGMGSDFN